MVLLFLYEETSIKSWVRCVCKVNARDSWIVIIKVYILSKDAICLLFKLEKWRAWEKCCLTRREKSIAPWWSIAVTIAIVLMLQEGFSIRFITGNLWNSILVKHKSLTKRLINCFKNLVLEIFVLNKLSNTCQRFSDLTWWQSAHQIKDGIWDLVLVCHNFVSY